jgi:hypothetical protein
VTGDLEASLQAAASEAEAAMLGTVAPRAVRIGVSTSIPNPLRAAGQPLKRVSFYVDPY